MTPFFHPIRFFTYGLFLCIWCSCTLCFSISIWMQWRSIIAFSISITLTIGWFNVIIITFYFAAIFYLWTDYLHHLRLGVLLQLSHKPNIALSRMRSHHSDCQNRTRTFSNDATGNSFGIIRRLCNKECFLRKERKRDWHSSDQHESSIPQKVLLNGLLLYVLRDHLLARGNMCGSLLQPRAEHRNSKQRKMIQWSNILCGTE